MAAEIRPSETPDALPRWELASIFPSLESPEFRAAFDRLRADLRAFAAFLDAEGIRRPADAPLEATPERIARFEEIVARLNALYEALRQIHAYVHCFVSTDARNDLAQTLASELRIAGVTLRQIESRCIAWIGALDLGTLLPASATAREHAFWLRRVQELARHQMPEGEESLAAELQPMALGGWARLHGDVTSLLTVRFTLRGEPVTLPMSAVRALAHDPDRSVRAAAFAAELEAWERAAIPLAAALNGIKGCQRTLHRRRGYADDIEPTLLANHIDRRTLEAMQAACVEAFPDFRRYMRAKARALGVERLAWYDLGAPVGAAERRYRWEEAEAFLLEQFGRYSSRLREFAARAFRERWIDAPPDEGKEGGAYCTGIRPGESRILMNYDGSFNSVSTLAHELGHAYHNLNLKERTPLQRFTPSTLAETASIFCETLAFDAALEEARGAERLALLDTSLQRDLLVVVDIHSRFLFEQAVFERRGERELPVRELCELMRDAQRRTYGDALDPEALHPYMWAVKGHYYGPVFYNYPYTFGLLFGLGLYARYREDPDGFRAGYDELLSATGLADASTLAARFGIDLRSPGFWRSSLDVIRRSIAEFERLAGATG